MALVAPQMAGHTEEISFHGMLSTMYYTRAAAPLVNVLVRRKTPLNFLQVSLTFCFSCFYFTYLSYLCHSE